MAALTINSTVKEIFGCTLYELHTECWRAITSSNDYFGESKGCIVSIKEIPPYGNKMDISTQSYYRSYGVVPYEKNYAINYRMYNKDGSPCGTEVYWSSFNGGILSHGTNATIAFKCPKITNGLIPSTILKFRFGSKHVNVIFGGTLPSLESKIKLINLIANKHGLNYTIEYPVFNTWVQMTRRCKFKTCKEFVRNLYKGLYDPQVPKESKLVVKAVYKGKSIFYTGYTVKDWYSEDKTYQYQNNIYKVWYEDGTTEYKPLNI